jgi:hypothetical protein
MTGEKWVVGDNVVLTFGPFLAKPLGTVKVTGTSPSFIVNVQNLCGVKAGKRYAIKSVDHAVPYTSIDRFNVV